MEWSLGGGADCLFDRWVRCRVARSLVPPSGSFAVAPPGLAIQGLIEDGRVRRVEHHPVAAVVAQVEGLVAREQGDGPRVASGGQDPIHLAAALGHWTGPALPGPIKAATN